MKLQSTTTLLDENDRLFLELLYDDFVGLMFKHARKYFQDQVDLEDIVQQAFLRLIKYLPTIKQLKRNALAVYIVNVIRSCSLDFYRKRNISRETCFADFYEGFEEGIEDNFDLDSLMDISFSLEQLTQVILQLPEKQQFVLEAKYLQFWSDAEIASTLNIEKQTVRTRLFRAKEKILLLLSEGENEKTSH